MTASKQRSAVPHLTCISSVGILPKLQNIDEIYIGAGGVFLYLINLKSAVIFGHSQRD